MMPQNDVVFADVTSLLSPWSVVVVGASDRENSLGGMALQYLQRFRFPGDIWVVNPKHKRVAGLPCYPSIRDIPGITWPCLVILAVPGRTAIDLIPECAAAGIHFGVTWSGGFSEVNAEGVALEHELVAACAEAGFTLMGPNCLGFIDTHRPLTATFSSFLQDEERLEPGKISMVSQSGGLASMVQAQATRAGFPFRYMISSGNEAVVTSGDYVHALADDPETKVISLYLEGTTDGAKLITALREAREAGKPVVVLKAGLAPSTARAAAAHTGSLVGEDRVWRAIFREEGAIQVDSMDELIDVTAFLSSAELIKLPKGNGVAIVTFGGGMGVIAADDCTRNGLRAPRFSEETRTRLRELVPPTASVENPVDLTPAAYNEPWIGQLTDVFEVLAADHAIDTVLAQFGTTWLDGFDIAKAVVDLRSASEKTVAVAWPFAPEGIPAFFRDEKVYMFSEYSRAARVLGRLPGVALRARPTDRPVTRSGSFDWKAHLPDVSSSVLVPEHRCTEVLAAAGLPMAAGRVTTSPDDAVAVALDIGLPVVLKGAASDVTHRGAAGLVKLDLRTEAEVQHAYRELSRRAAKAGVVLEGVYVQQMVGSGDEILVSAFRDPAFGVMVTIGTGGNLTEIVADVQLARAPIDPGYAGVLLQDVRGGSWRTCSEQETNLDRLQAFLSDFSVIAAQAPWCRFTLEINPIRWDGERAVGVDSLLVVEEP